MKSEEKNKEPEISPCCNVKALLSARQGDREAWQCSKCKKYNAYKLFQTYKTNERQIKRRD